MGEKFFKKPLDQIIIRHSQSHQGKLKQINEKLKKNFSDEKIFSPESQKQLDEWADENLTEKLLMLERIFDQIKDLQASQSPGHDMSHLLDNLNSALRIFDEFKDFSQAEKIEVALACLGHDLGRSVENQFDSINKKEVSYLTPALIGRRIKDFKKFPEHLKSRLLYDIASSSQAKTGHRTADVVHQCDREQLMGSTIIARAFVFNSQFRETEFMVPDKDEFKSRLLRPESSGDKWILPRIEFFMRNVHPALSPQGAQVSDEHKRETAVIEMLATVGKKKEYMQIFAPELGLVKPEELDATKKSIPQHIFDQAIVEKDKFLSQIDENSYQPGQELEQIYKIIESDRVSLPPDFDQIMREKLNRCTGQERKNLWLICTYALEKRHERRLADMERLEKCKSDGGVSDMVKNWVLEELKTREALYNNRL